MDLMSTIHSGSHRSKPLMVHVSTSSLVIEDLRDSGWDVVVSNDKLLDPQNNRQPELLCPCCNNRSSIIMGLANIPYRGRVVNGSLEIENLAELAMTEITTKFTGIDLMDAIAAITTISELNPDALIGDNGFEMEGHYYHSFDDFIQSSIGHGVRERLVLEDVTCPVCGEDMIDYYWDQVSAHHNDNCEGCLWCTGIRTRREEVEANCRDCYESSCLNCAYYMLRAFYNLTEDGQ